MSLRNKKPRKKDVTRWVDAIVRKHIYGSANTSRSAALFLFSRTLASSMVNTEEQAVAATKSWDRMQRNLASPTGRPV